MKEKNNGALPKSLLFGVLFSFLIVIIISFLFSLIISTLKNPTGAVRLSSLIVLLVSGAVSGFIICRHNKDYGMRVAFLSSVLFSILLILIALLSRGGSVGGVHFMNSLCYILISFFISLLGKNKKRRRRR